MLESSSKWLDKLSRLPNWSWLVILPVWVYLAFLASQYAISYAFLGLNMLGLPIASINEVVLISLISTLAYGLAIAIVVLVPYKIWKRKTNRVELGIPDLPSWMDIVLSVPAYIVYMIVSAFVMVLAIKIFPGINIEQSQDLPFSATMLISNWHYAMAFVIMVIIGPFAEELLYRGYLYGKLRQVSSAVVVILVTSLAFGAAHLWTGGNGPLQWAVAIDTMVLSIMMCTLREYTGAIWAGVLMHAIKNGLAFYLLFINPQILDQVKSALLPFL